MCDFSLYKKYLILSCLLNFIFVNDGLQSDSHRFGIISCNFGIPMHCPLPDFVIISLIIFIQSVQCIHLTSCAQSTANTKCILKKLVCVFSVDPHGKAYICPFYFYFLSKHMY